MKHAVHLLQGHTRADAGIIDWVSQSGGFGDESKASHTSLMITFFGFPVVKFDIRETASVIFSCGPEYGPTMKK